MSKRRATTRRKKKKPSGQRPAKPHVSTPAVEKLLQQAAAHHRASRHAEARQFYTQALNLDPKHPHAHYGLGQCLSRLGNNAEGIRLTKRAIALLPQRAQYHVSLADLYCVELQIAESDASAHKALALDPRNTGAYCLLASNAERRLEFEAGIEFLRAAEQVDPHGIYVQTLLARLERRNKEYETARARIERILQRPNIEADYQRRILFEQAAVLDKLGEYEGAFAAIKGYGEMTLQTPAAQRLNLQARPARIATYKAGIDEQLFQRWGPSDFADERKAPAFLVGFPRSGTTMTEQVLAAHPHIETADERPYLNNIRAAWVKQVGGSNDVSGMFNRLTLDGVKELRKSYWEQVDEDFECDLSGKFFLDKLPLNIIDLGFINVVFPDAKIIVALRDPRDVCLSCLMQDFSLNNAMVHFLRLEDTATFYAQVMDIYLALRPCLSVESIEIRYEDTVDGLEAQARRIFALLGVEWDPAVLAFHERARGKIISTPSFEAVTQPVHRGAIGRWRNYEKSFEPILPTLARFVDAFGYAPD